MAKAIIYECIIYVQVFLWNSQVQKLLNGGPAEKGNYIKVYTRCMYIIVYSNN